MDFWKVKRWLRLHLGECNKYHLLRYHLNKNQATKAMVKYTGNQSKDSYVLSKMKEAWVKYHWGFDEFFYFDYLNLSNEERRSFVPEYEKNIFCSRVNNPEQAIIFYNKWKTYCKFIDFYKRDAVYVRGVPDLKREDVLDFVNKYSSFIMKPVEAACGRGIKL